MTGKELLHWFDGKFYAWARWAYHRLLRYAILRPILIRLRYLIEGIFHYFRTHPRSRIVARIAGPPIAFFFFFFFVVWIETPGNRELRNIQNQVASEVYSADSVLIGRYFIQDRTEVS